jgi:hypothetical protein
MVQIMVIAPSEHTPATFRLPPGMQSVRAEDFPVGTSLVELASEKPVWLADGDAVAQMGINEGALVIMRVEKETGVMFMMPNAISRDFIKEAASKHKDTGTFDLIVLGGSQSMDASKPSIPELIQKRFDEFGILPNVIHNPTPPNSVMNIGVARVRDELKITTQVQKE